MIKNCTESTFKAGGGITVQRVLIENGLLVMFALSCGSIAYFLVKHFLQAVPLEKLKAYSKPTGKELLALNIKQKKFGSFQDPKFLLKGAIGAAITAFLFWDTPYRHSTIPVGLLAGLLIGKFVEKSIARVEYRTRAREIAILYDVMDIFSDRYPIHLSLARAARLTPGLKPAIDRCLSMWTRGPVRALQAFAKEVNIVEAEILASVLQHITMAGKTERSGILSEEAFKLEERLKSNFEKQLAARPLYQTIYIAIPGFALMGIILFPLWYKAIQAISSLRAVN